MQLSEKIIDKYLKNTDQAPYISIYLPTIPSSNSQTINEDKIRYKNALQAIDAEARQHESLKDTLEQLEQLLENHDFWLHQGLGLAVLANQEGYETIRLPFEVTPVAVVADKYVVSPLLAMNSLVHSYYLLDVNLKGPKLYAGNSYRLEEMVDAGLPGAIEDEIDIEERKRTVGSRAGAGGQGAVYYGYNKVDESQENNAELYLKLLAEAVDKALDDSSTPLLLVGLDKHLATLRPMLKHSKVFDDNIAVDHDVHRQIELHQAANQAVEHHSRQGRQQAVESYQEVDFEQRVDGQTAVQVAAENGQVDELLLPVLRITTDSVRSIAEPQTLVDLPSGDEFNDFEKAVRAVAEQSGKITPVEQADFADDPSMKAKLRFS